MFLEGALQCFGYDIKLYIQMRESRFFYGRRHDADWKNSRHWRGPSSLGNNGPTFTPVKLSFCVVCRGQHPKHQTSTAIAESTSFAGERTLINISKAVEGREIMVSIIRFLALGDAL